MIATFQRGETFVTTITPRLPGETLRAAMKLASAGFAIPPANAPEAAVMTVEDIVIDGEPAWQLTLSSAVSETLIPGSYVADARIVLGNGQVQITDPIRINVEERVTGP